MKVLKVGDVVRNTTPLLKNPIGAYGVVFHEYDLGNHAGVQIIFENGEYDGFSIDEQENMLEYVRHEPACDSYLFTHVIQVTDDFDKGFFALGFREYHSKTVKGLNDV